MLVIFICIYNTIISLDVHLEEEPSHTRQRKSNDKHCRSYVTISPGIPQASNDVICSRRVDLIHTAHVMDILYQQHKYVYYYHFNLLEQCDLTVAHSCDLLLV